MWPVVAHHCKACGYDTFVQYTAAVFSEAHYCNHCGASSIGVKIRTQQELARMQTADMQQSDELAGLFARSMNFSNPTPPPEKQVEAPQQQSAVEEPKRVYASMHYVPPTGFSHTTPQASPEPEVQPLSDNQIAEIMIQHGIDPHTLFPSQVALFRNAEQEQQLRLLELWRISPPNLGAYDIAKEQASWLETTLQREEEMARLRYERSVISAQGIGSPYVEPPMEEISRPSSAPEARAAQPAASTHLHAEPYMMSGYELLAQREYERSKTPDVAAESKMYNQATDPVYQASGAWDRGLADMENGYGAFEAMRNGQGMASMNGLDEDMVM